MLHGSSWTGIEPVQGVDPPPTRTKKSAARRVPVSRGISRATQIATTVSISQGLGPVEMTDNESLGDCLDSPGALPDEMSYPAPGERT